MKLLLLGLGFLSFTNQMIHMRLDIGICPHPKSETKCFDNAPPVCLNVNGQTKYFKNSCEACKFQKSQQIKTQTGQVIQTRQKFKHATEEEFNNKKCQPWNQ